MKTSEALRRADGVMRRRGFCTGNYRDSAGRVCVVGALGEIAGPGHNPRWWYDATRIFSLAMAGDADYGAASANDRGTEASVLSALDEAARIAESSEWTDRAWKEAP